MTPPDHDPARVAEALSQTIKRAILMTPFHSRGSGLRGGHMAPYNEGNAHMGKPALFIRKQRPDYSGDYSLTPLGLAVRDYLKETQP